ncbi:MAG TPA: D-alanyl-D-alanine carboxypeptidase/D-alanyl-D-alanine-endopeptidase [Epsilonproteobacteria bacterium]|nr:D-alanyl-D-alanine carboxypeptidase/D-alanyl-D-alanine-endopeptidase [Campylobacterota bacterium]
MMFRFISYWIIATVAIFASMPAAITQMINESQIPSSAISIYIKESGKWGKTIVSHNAQVPRKPASVIKIATTYAALLKLGSGYRWKTQVYTNGRIRSGVLEGDLIVKGGGDPALGNDDVAKIANYIKAQGIHTIKGNIVIDRTKFNVPPQSSARFDNYPYSPYNALPDAMMFNENTTKITITPSRGRFSVSQSFDDKSVKIVNNLTPVSTPCKGAQSWPKININQSAFPSVVTLQGQLSTRCPQRDHVHIVTRSYYAFYYALRNGLKKEGVGVSGGLKFAPLPKGAKKLFAYHSKPLSEIIATTNKNSNNLFARQIFLTLGAKVYNAPSTLESSRKAMKEILSRSGIAGANSLQADNGSGLSRSASSTAIAFGALLEHAYSRYKHEWLQTLAIAGVDGTIKTRFTAQRNRAWMKTGTIKGVRNIAGYVQDNSGKVYIVVLLIESGHQRGAWLQDRIIGWVANGASQGSRVKSAIAKTTSATTPIATQAQAPSGNYYIQVASFRKEPNKSFLDKISSHHLRYTIYATPQGKKLLIGPYKTQNEAKNALPSIRQNLELNAFIVTW